MPGVCDDEVGVVTVDADPLAAPTACTMDHELLPLPPLPPDGPDADWADEATDGRAPVDEDPARADADWLPAWFGAPLRLASDETLEESGTLLGTLNRVHSPTWSRHEFSCTVIAQPGQTERE